MNETAGTRVSLQALLHTAYGAEAEVESRLNTIGLSHAKLVALQALANAGESLTLGQLAERLSCVKSNITQLVDRLEADGFVMRQADPQDRRARLAVLTPTGRDAFTEGTRLQQAAERDLLDALTPEERTQLAELLRKLRKAPA